MSLQEAENYLKSAEKNSKKKLFSKPDPEAAMSDYREAAKIFQKLDMLDRAKDAYIAAATSAVAAQLEQPAAVFYREAAHCARRQLDERKGGVTKKDIAGYHRKCAEYMALSGKLVESAHEYVVMCKYIDDLSAVDAAMKQALEYFEQEKKPMQACSVIMDLIDSLCEDVSQISNTVQLIGKAKQMYSSMSGYGFKIDLLTLLHIILLLHRGDLNEAREQLLKFDSYKDSAAMAEDLINAFDKRDEDALKEAKAITGARLTLTNNMLRLLDRLTVPDTDDDDFL